jgi:hypothetical protein
VLRATGRATGGGWTLEQHQFAIAEWSAGHVRQGRTTVEGTGGQRHSGAYSSGRRTAVGEPITGHTGGGHATQALGGWRLERSAWWLGRWSLDEGEDYVMDERRLDTDYVLGWIYSLSLHLLGRDRGCSPGRRSAPGCNNIGSNQTRILGTR